MENFSKLPGHQEQKEYLLRIINHQRIAHSFIFSGPEGVGKINLARAFALGLNCLDFDGDACGVCANCNHISRGLFPDLMEISPHKNMIKIDHIRDITVKLLSRPYQGKYRVVIINQADLMNIYAANALLKTLEEPVPNNIIILICANYRRLPGTIVSRCCLLRFNFLLPEQLESILEKKFPDRDRDRDTIQLVSKIANGSIRRAEKLLQAEEMEFRQGILEFALDLMNLKEPQSMDKLFSWVEAAKFDQQKLEEMLNYLRLFIRDIILVISTGQLDNIINCDIKEKLARIAPALELKNLLNLYARIEDIAPFLRHNLNRRLLSENLFIQIRKLTGPEKVGQQVKPG